MSLSFQIQKMDLSEDYDTRLRRALGHKIMPSRISKVTTTPLYSEDGCIIVGSSKVEMEEVILRDIVRKEIDALVDEYTNKDVLKKYNLPVSNKVLFYGPSGCGKTLMATALANSLSKPLLIINLSRIVDSGLGRTSANIAQAFEEANRIHGILFFDEFDALGKSRTEINDHGETKRITSAILQMMDSINEDVLMIAATNHIDFLDPAVVRRFSKKIQFLEPNKKETERLLEQLIRKAGLTISQQTKTGVAGKLRGRSYADIQDIFVNALKKLIIANKDKKSLLIDNLIMRYL